MGKIPGDRGVWPAASLFHTVDDISLMNLNIKQRVMHPCQNKYKFHGTFLLQSRTRFIVYLLMTFTPDSESSTVVPGKPHQKTQTPTLSPLSSGLQVNVFLFLFLIRYFLHLHFKCYPKSPPDPPLPTLLPTHSHFLALAFPRTEAYKVCKTKGPLFPMMAG